jgi:hypothetical protein
MLLRQRTIVAAGAVVAALACAAPAPARIIEIGGKPAATPSCPATPCWAVSRTTGYQVKVLRSRSAYVVPRNGRIVAWTIGLSNPNNKQIDFFTSRYGEASAQLTVLRVGKRLYRRVMGQSPAEKLAPYFGQSVQFPLETSIRVRKGQVIALTVPTWAPALTDVLNDGSSWRASRPKGKCDDTDTQTAQTKLNVRTQYRCLYRARLTYSATLITNPRPNKKPKV